MVGLFFVVMMAVIAAHVICKYPRQVCGVILYLLSLGLRILGVLAVIGLVTWGGFWLYQNPPDQGMMTVAIGFLVITLVAIRHRQIQRWILAKQEMFQNNTRRANGNYRG